MIKKWFNKKLTVVESMARAETQSMRGSQRQRVNECQYGPK